MIEATAYRTLAEGRDGNPPRPEVLRDLVNDGALDPPWCFGRGDAPPRDCRDAAASNPLLFWPQPETDRPDAFFRRQFSDAGQCFHYMGTLGDALSDPLPGTDVPRALATRAIVRCNDLLDGLLRQVVVDGGPGTRRSGFGLYELMHAVGDSFSGSHTDRAETGVASLRVWKPIEKIAGLPTERSKKIPDSAFHKWDDHRDKTYVLEGGVEACETRTANPYDVPYECLSPEGESARRALAELLVVVRDLRLAQLAAPKGADTKPEASGAWRAYRTRWFTPVHACAGEECGARQPQEISPGTYAFLGLGTRYDPTAGVFDVGARASVLRYAEDINPFVYELAATLGYRAAKEGSGQGVFGISFDFVLPVGFKAAVGFTPAEVRTVFGGTGGGAEVVTRLLRFDYKLSDGVQLSLSAPLEVNWRKPRADWSFGAGLAWGLTSPRFAGGHTLLHHDEEVVRRDDAWVPPPAPYGRLGGRRPTLYAVSGISVADPPEGKIEGNDYGLGMLGAEVTWDRDRWGGRYAFTPAVALTAGRRSTTGESGYVTGTLSLGIRWFVLGPLGLSVTAVRLEYGPKTSGKDEADATLGAHGSPGDAYYFLAGSRIGVALRLGIFDLLVEGPTIAWDSQPFGAHEILGFRLGLRLK